MKLWLLPFWALAFASLAVARPLLIEGGAALPFYTGSVGLSGDDLFAVVRSNGTVAGDQYAYSANHYHRNGAGQWQLVRAFPTEIAPFNNRFAVVMNSTIAAVAMPGGLRIYERTSAGWAESALDVSPRPLGQSLALHGNTLLATEGGCAARALELNRAANGHWTLTATLPVATGTCVTGLDLDTNAAIIGSQIDFAHASSLRIFERAGSNSWTIASTFAPRSDETVLYTFGRAVALHDDLALASGSDHGAYVYRRGASGWAQAGFFSNPDRAEWDADDAIEINDDYVLRTAGSFNRLTGAVYLYRQRADHGFAHLATMVGARDLGPSNKAIIDGQRVIALTGDFGIEPVEFNLPASFDVPALVQDDFESGAASQWTPLAGSQFAIVSNGTTHVYRQSSLVGDAAAVHSADLINQSIGADIRLNAVSGNDRWVGLMTRYIDESNYYYVTLRDTNRVVLKRMLNGVFTEIISVPIDVAPGHTFHLNLESSGTHQAVDIDGQRVIRTFDSTLAHGHTGLRMYKAAADFDNVVVSPGPVGNLIWADRETLGGNWSIGSRQFSQGSTAGDARLTSGVPSEDQVVQASITVNSFASSGSPWVGLIARYQDGGNYYYVTARKTNELSLRKLTDGAISVLGTVPLTVSPNAPFVLRLEAIQDRLRVYVNDVLRIERSGADIVTGKVGVVTYRAAASFDQYSAVEP
ncbi:MAG TPA: hypothetical protein VK624_01860 [Steroidobacteraceae bacterium]|nr:hypothetical protein [Steroidobacteraceae bacterium]